MYNPRNNNPFGGPNQYNNNRNGFGSRTARYQFQAAPYGMQGAQASSLISKVMGLLAFSFIFATIGAFIGTRIIGFSTMSYFVMIIAGFIVLFALQAMIHKPGLNLFLLYLFTFIEGMALSPLITILF